MTSKRILVTGAGSGFGEGAAIGLAQAGHTVIATVQISPQVTELRKKAAELGLEENLRVEKLDILDAYDVDAAVRDWDIDVLWSNAGIGQSGPTAEIPVDLVRQNFETNVFAPLTLAQKFIRKWIDAERTGKVVFTSSMGGLFTPPWFGSYVATKHALESFAESLREELRPFGIKVQTINPGAYLTGFNETLAETAFKWLDDEKNFNKRAQVQAGFDELLGGDEGRLDPKEMIDAMVRIVPENTGKFRNVVPAFVEKMLHESQATAWDAEI
ncbi:short-chain dehydrogenase [Streptomyces sp. WAC 01325]|uniref:SDR family oxidoreductase n=1 Tax=Streptomyces sp. WAC 01325 TaxID=2203202 RepID=UPI000F87A0B9|nr:SDR family oxidoreductase [Streptomyces sp. WAC 01325]RSM97474.1 short-chain dehydrogenase [Streptomyces sp. WAC 01325]